MKRSKKQKQPDHIWINPFVIGVIVLRIAGALSMFWFPWWGLMVTYIFDFYDCYFLIQKAGYTREKYHALDKWLDWVCYAVEYCIAVWFGLAPLFTVLLLWRFIGQYLFIKTKNTLYFLLTPNIFEIAYMWLVAARLEHITDKISSMLYWNIFIFLICVKIVQEIWVHYFWPWYLKRYGFPSWVKHLGYHNVGY